MDYKYLIFLLEVEWLHKVSPMITRVYTLIESKSFWGVSKDMEGLLPPFQKKTWNGCLYVSQSLWTRYCNGWNDWRVVQY
jgi:hypothetical protein